SESVRQLLSERVQSGRANGGQRQRQEKKESRPMDRRPARQSAPERSIVSRQQHESRHPRPEPAVPTPQDQTGGHEKKQWQGNGGGRFDDARPGEAGNDKAEEVPVRQDKGLPPMTLP